MTDEPKSPQEDIRLAVEMLTIESQIGNLVSVFLRTLEGLRVPAPKLDAILSGYDSWSREYTGLLKEHFGMEPPWRDPNSDLVPFMVQGMGPRTKLAESESKIYTKWTFMRPDDPRQTREELFFRKEIPKEVVYQFLALLLRRREAQAGCAVVTAYGVDPKILNY